MVPLRLLVLSVLIGMKLGHHMEMVQINHWLYDDTLHLNIERMLCFV